ncbi:hypothetical protein ELZ88_24295 (plasmid) [Salmonella enterica subsp. enterica serovar Karamoja]|uniref:Uncharacterized protein n=1 Tax=Salmonella enterica subsp. enterica serovar Karamoja TaxID=2500153 RepID=A0A3Q9MPT9_SALET|nr:hypothetical protein [Salmonella enterica]AZT39658.1 hypothetical protein ELZ88_24295 [Salmonella enterica subsp. enterica serovar Karamoja]AZT44445.1 hypothetical protein EL007_24650 [Salmonella enterica subsp. enterica serovar Karamoja]
MMTDTVSFTLSFYQDMFRRTEEAIRSAVRTMPPVVAGNFTDGYLQGIIFHWWQLAGEYGIPPAVIDAEERHLRTLAGLPEREASR